MTAATEARPSAGNRFKRWLPEHVDRRVLVAGWLSFVAEVLIIATGGTVRLTGSGLGCPTWPTCTPDSLVPTADMGIHGMIEFGNRTMTGVVGLLAVAVLLLVWRMRHRRRDLFALAVVVVLGVIAQAIVGGVTVWTGLNPFIVGFHYISSLLLACVCAAFLVRAHSGAAPRRRAVPPWFAVGTHIGGLALAVTILFGVLTTGSGPHSGDNDVVRQGFDATILAHVHAWPGYVLGGLVVLLTIAAWALKLPPRRWLLVLAIAIAVQVAVGVWQSREGLPPLLVGIHMVLAALSAAAYTVVVMRQRSPAPIPSDAANA